MIEFMMDFVLTRVCAPQALPVIHRLISHLAAALACLPYSACIFRSVFCFIFIISLQAAVDKDFHALIPIVFAIALHA
jgi:hypothetical protein